MFGILRDVPSGINRVGPVGSASVGSQVSVLPSAGSKTPACHWFTATPNPACSVFKPFVFCPDVVFTPLTESPAIENDPAKANPRFQRKADRRHPLYIAHESVRPLPGDSFDQDVVKTLMEVEADCVCEMDSFLASYDGSCSNELKDLFKDIVESEMKFYPKWTVPYPMKCWWLLWLLWPAIECHCCCVVVHPLRIVDCVLIVGLLSRLFKTQLLFLCCTMPCFWCATIFMMSYRCSCRYL